MAKTLEFHRIERDWLKVRCPCGCWSKEPAQAFASRAARGAFEYGCAEGKLHTVSASEAARLRSLIEHPGWN